VNDVVERDYTDWMDEDGIITDAKEGWFMFSLIGDFFY